MNQYSYKLPKKELTPEEIEAQPRETGFLPSKTRPWTEVFFLFTPRVFKKRSSRNANHF